MNQVEIHSFARRTDSFSAADELIFLSIRTDSNTTQPCASTGTGHNDIGYFRGAIFQDVEIWCRRWAKKFAETSALPLRMPRHHVCGVKEHSIVFLRPRIGVQKTEVLQDQQDVGLKLFSGNSFFILGKRTALVAGRWSKHHRHLLIRR